MGDEIATLALMKFSVDENDFRDTKEIQDVKYRIPGLEEQQKANKVRLVYIVYI